MARRSWFGTIAGLCAWTAACGATVTIDRNDGGAVGADAPLTGTCRRPRVGAVVTLSQPDTARRFQLLDAVPTEDGAVVAWRARSLSGTSDPVQALRIREDGSTDPWSAVGSGTRTEIVSVDRDAPLEFSMVWQGARARLVALAGGRTDRGACAFVSFEGRTQQAWQLVDFASLGAAFSLAGCGSIEAESGGWSMLTSEVRALWGTQAVQLDDSGRPQRTTRLPMTANQPIGPVLRSRLAEGYLARWVEAVPRTVPAQKTLHVRRFRRNHDADGEDVVVSQASGSLERNVVVDTPAGLLAVWTEGIDSFPPVDSLAVRPLARDGSPAAPTRVWTELGFALGGVDAVVRGDDVLAVAALGSGEIHATLLVLGTAGTTTQPPLPLPLTASDATGLTVLRVIATRRGALVIGTADVGESGGRVVAVPIECLP